MPSTTLFLCHFCSVLTSACTSTGFLSFLSGFLSCNCQWGNDYSDNPREVFCSLKLDDFRKFYSRGSGEFPQRGSSPYLLPLTVFSVNCENFWNALFIKEINVGGYDAWSEGAVDAATEQPLTRKQHLKKKKWISKARQISHQAETTFAFFRAWWLAHQRAPPRGCP